MPLTRREFIVGLGALTGVRMMAPIVVRAGDGVGAAEVDPAMRDANRLVVIFLAGGNDGLNTVIPRGDVGADLRYSVYRQVRPSLHYTPEQVLPLDRPGDDERAMGLHPGLTRLHALYGQGRVAVVQGVDYPNHSYSHFTSTDIWQTGRPESNAASGWLGRHLDRAGIPDGSLRGLGIGYELPLILQGEDRQGVEVDSITNTRFSDGSGGTIDARHDALRRYGDHPPIEPLRHFAGVQAASAVGLVEALRSVPVPPPTNNPLADSLLTARTLLEGDFGVETVFLAHLSGYDTHVGQKPLHANLMTQLDQGIEAFLFGTIGGTPIAGVGPMSDHLAARTLIVTTSEFGRRIGENGATASDAGTDHGAAGPLFLIGPPGASNGVSLVPGLHGDHPPMGTPLAPADNLVQTTELRRVYQSILQEWLGDPDPGYEGAHEPLPGLFSAS